MSKLDVCIPTYEFGGLGADVLEWSFHKLFTQTFKDFSVVVSDNSFDDKTKLLCDRWSDRLDIKYFHNEKRGAATNSNNCILKATAPILKFLCADDYLYDDNSLKIIYENFDDKTTWLFTEYVHTTDRLNFYRHFVPQPLPNIFTNLLGTPSALAIRNPKFLPAIELFDENLKYCYDVEAYWKWTKVLGVPKVVHSVGLVNYIWPNSVSSQTDYDMINKENLYLLNKHGASR